MKNVTAVILGGGQGKRLYPLTRERAKPAVSFAGKYRLIDIPISNCINSGIKRIFVLTQFLSASLHRHIMQTFQFDTFTDGFVDILAAEQTPRGERWFQGTADAVRATLRHTTYYKFDYMIILSGDHLYRMDYQKMLRFHKKRNAHITVSVTPVTAEHAPEFGLLKVNEEGRILQFVEKPQDPEVIKQFVAPEKFFCDAGMEPRNDLYLASMGIYIFDSKAVFDLLGQTQYEDFGKEVIPNAIDKFRVAAFPFGDYWRDIGTIKSYFEANISLAQPNAPFFLYQPNWPLYTRTRSLPPSRVTQSQIGDCILVEGSQIHGARISDSIVGTRSVVNKGTIMEEVVMSGADYYQDDPGQTAFNISGGDLPKLGVGENCVIKRAIIDKNVRIGNNVRIVTGADAADKDESLYCIRDGITIIPRGTVIPDNTEIIN
ncbi:glucose-1-phosphate adenylyltransferase [candidate division KSB1 bacterium 4484_87]|nr:MAG: glucose-1-phosphate adenylyltransferase [candidate division KSB1 bacterium 4484_87]